MKSFKYLPITLALLAALALLNSCGGKDSGSSRADPSAVSSGSNRDPDGRLAGKLVIWTFFGQVKDMAAKFEQKYPGVQVDVRIYPGDQYPMKLLAALQSGRNLPDVFDLERGYIGKFIDSDYLTDLSAMGAEALVKDDIPYVAGLGRSSDGRLKAISDHSSPGAFWYLRDTARQYLGTDDPARISAMVGTWDGLIETGERVYRESKGKAHLIASAGDLFDWMAYNARPWVQDGKLIIDPKWRETYEVQREIRENNVDAGLPFLSAGWGAALNSGAVVLTSMPAWAGYMVDDENGRADGKYGVAATPLGFYMGGTYRAISSASPNKALAYAFIRYIASPEWQTYNLAETGNLPASASVYKASADTYKPRLFGDQKILGTYYETVMKLPALPADKYGEDILSLWRETAGRGIASDWTYDKTAAAFKKEVRLRFPELEID